MVIHVNLDRTADLTPALCGALSPICHDADVLQMAVATCAACLDEGREQGLAPVSELFADLELS